MLDRIPLEIPAGILPRMSSKTPQEIALMIILLLLMVTELLSGKKSPGILSQAFPYGVAAVIALKNPSRFPGKIPAAFLGL